MNNLLTLWSSSPRLLGTSFTWTKSSVIVGRCSNCDMVVRDESVSRRHAQIQVSTEGISVRDLGSRNGTFIDNQRVWIASLEAGQRLRFGRIEFFLKLQEQSEVNSETETGSGAMSEPEGNLPVAGLSRAQRRVFEFLLWGYSEKEVATQLEISPTTVHNHIQAIYRLLKVHSRSQFFAHILGRPNPGTS